MPRFPSGSQVGILPGYMGLQPSKESSQQREPTPPTFQGSDTNSFESLESKAAASEFSTEVHKARLKAASKIILGLPEYEKFSLNELLVLCLPKMPGNNKLSLSKTISSLLGSGYLSSDKLGYISVNTERLSQIRTKVPQTSDYEEIKLKCGTKRLLTPLRKLVTELDPEFMPTILGLAVRFEQFIGSKNLNSETIEAAMRDLIKAGWLINTGNDTVARFRKIPRVDDVRQLNSSGEERQKPA